MSKSIYETVFNNLKHGALAVRYWDGRETAYGHGAPAVKIIFNEEPQLAQFAADPVLALGEAYMDGVVDFEGSLDALLTIMRDNFPAALKEPSFPRKCLARLAESFSGDHERQKEDVQAHYDLGNDFFSLWLDSTMSYSCAYFIKPEDSLETAQLQKIDLSLKKMRLKPGMRLLDIGCGWGWLIRRAVEQYGVTALGLTLSEEQCRGAREQLERAGLSAAAEVRLLNYLDLNKNEGLFDRVVSVGMFEHVGRDYFHRYMAKVDELLKPGGLSLLHTLTALTESETNSWIKKYIFPGGYIPSFRETVALLPDCDFHLLHAESLRRHYVRTLEIWFENFSRREVYEQIQSRFSQKFMRMWSLYLRAAAASLRQGALDIHQIVFSKGVNNNLPMTLTDIYTS